MKKLSKQQKSVLLVNLTEYSKLEGSIDSVINNLTALRDEYKDRFDDLLIEEEYEGQEITNQVDGCCCAHPGTRGFIVPLPRDFDGLKWLDHDIFNPASNYLNFPQEGSLENYTQCLIDNGFKNAKLTGICEAWIHFTFESEGKIKTAILTWENSD